MASNPKSPLFGELSVDASEEAPHLVDLPEGARKGMRHEQPGYERAEEEISANQATYGDFAGITNSTVQEVKDATEVIKRIRARLHAARKLVEILEESIAFHDDRRQRLVHSIAKTVEMHATARGDHELLARYELTRAYRSSIAKKAVRTRRRNQNDVIDAPVETPIETPAE